MEWETVIGLEIHAQLNTLSKIFSGASTAYGAEPNSQACLVDLGYPGQLPVLNAQAVAKAVKFGLATGSKVARRSVFARKNYFYPDFLYSRILVVGLKCRLVRATQHDALLVVQRVCEHPLRSESTRHGTGRRERSSGWLHRHHYHPGNSDWLNPGSGRDPYP